MNSSSSSSSSFIFGFFFCLIYALYTTSTTTVVESNHSRQRSHNWAQQALEFIRRWDCSRFQPDSDSTIQCSAAKTVPSSQIRLYVATGSAPDLQATLPDQRLTGGSHEAFLVLDPSPGLSFGHFVFIFAVDSVSNRSDCQKDTQTLIPSHNDCLQLILKRCGNDSLNNNHNFSRGFLQHGVVVPNNAAVGATECATNFIPFVFELQNTIPTNGRLYETRLKQKLTCLTGVPQFAPCPAHLKIGSKQHPNERIVGDVCESYGTPPHHHHHHHHHRHRHHVALTDCSQNLQARLSKSVPCEWLVMCNHAAIVGGVWNHPPGKFQMEETLQLLREDLTANHKFARNYVKTFYADGKTVTANLSLHNLYPASFKQLVRSHLRHVCQQWWCVDTFAVFLIGWGKRDGSLLLWDKDFDGFASENETYTPSEIYEDLSSCRANRLYVVADYAYSGQLAEFFENASTSASSAAKNMIMLTTGHLPAAEHQLTKVWSDEKSKRTCFTDAASSPLYHVTNSFSNFKPIVFDGSRGELRTTISGTRCNDIGAGGGSSDHEQNSEKRQNGCSEVPMALFYAKNKQRNRQNSNNHHYQQEQPFLSPNSNETTSKQEHGQWSSIDP